MKTNGSGWKTTVGAILAIIIGAWIVYNDKYAEIGLGFISLGFMGFGLGDKMEKIKKALVILVACLIGYSALPAHAAMTCADDGIRHWPGQKDYRLSMTCTFDTTPGTAVAAFPSTIQAVIDSGLYVYQFTVKPGTTGPTDNSDLQILDASGATILAAAGNGANVIDNATVTSVIYGDGPTAGSTNHYPKGDGEAWTITVTNNAVNNSSFKLIMKVGETY